MGLANPFKSKTNNALENVMYFAERCYAHPDKLEASLKLDDLRKVFLRKIQADQIALSYMSPIHSAPSEIFYFQLFGPALGKLVSEKKPETVAMKETLDLAQAGILPTPWKPTSMIANIGIYGLGYGRRPWLKQQANHKILWCPTFGIGIVHGGNHSLTAAVITNELTHFNIEESYDLSQLFDAYYFDGHAFKAKDDSKFVSIPEIMEFGIVYEISRMIHQIKNAGE